MAEDGCSLSVGIADQMKTFDIDFKPGEDVLYAQLGSGKYQVKGISCGSVGFEFTGSTWPGFEVRTGNLSVLNGLLVTLQSNRNLGVQFKSRSQTREDTLNVIHRLPQSVQQHLISGFTGQKILEAQLKQSMAMGHYQLTSAHHNSLKLDEQDAPTFDLCFQEEQTRNGLMLGNPHLDADYTNGVLIQIKQKETWNTFSSSFFACVKSALGQYHPRLQDKLSYSISL